MKRVQKLAVCAIAVTMMAGGLWAGRNRECLTLDDVHIPVIVNEFGELELDDFSDGFGSLKACVNTRNLKGTAKARGFVPNFSGRKLKLRNDPELDSTVEFVVDDFTGIDIDVLRSQLKINRNGNFRYSNRFVVEDVDDFDT